MITKVTQTLIYKKPEEETFSFADILTTPGIYKDRNSSILLIVVPNTDMNRPNKVIILNCDTIYVLQDDHEWNKSRFTKINADLEILIKKYN